MKKKGKILLNKAGLGLFCGVRTNSLHVLGFIGDDGERSVKYGTINLQEEFFEHDQNVESASLNTRELHKVRACLRSVRREIPMCQC